MDFIARESSYPTPLANSTLLPLMLLSLARQKNSPSTTETSSTILSEYDFIVVGAGSAGATVAGRLSEVECANVLLLEAGRTPPLLTDIPGYARNFWFTDIDWAYKTVPQKHTGRLLVNRQVIWPNGKAIGGSSILNGMLYSRGNKNNYDDWATQGAEGWSFKDVLPYFKKMEDNKNDEFIANGYHGVGGSITVEKPRFYPEIKSPLLQAAVNMGYGIVDSNGPRQTGVYDIQSTIRQGQRCSTAKGYLVPAENRKNLHILPNAFVKKILIENNKAIGVLFESNGVSHEVKSRQEIILSAGAANTPQLLMLSGIGPKEELQKHKIPIVLNLPVGHNLQDHIAAVMNYELNSTIKPITEKLSDPKEILQFILTRSGTLVGTLLDAVVGFMKGLSIRPKIDFPNIQIYFEEAAATVLKQQIGLTESAYEQIYAPYENKPFFICIAQNLQPKSRGFIKLNSTNPYDPPLIDPNYLADVQDIKDIVQAMKVCQRFATSEPMQTVGSRPFNTIYPGCEEFYEKGEDDYYECMARSVIITSSHYSGTCKMGSVHDPSAVVDPQLRVKGIQGLRVVDASVMPIVPSGNTNAPVIMVAEKASDLIKQSMRCL